MRSDEGRSLNAESMQRQRLKGRYRRPLIARNCLKHSVEQIRERIFNVRGCKNNACLNASSCFATYCWDVWHGKVGFFRRISILVEYQQGCRQL